VRQELDELLCKKYPKIFRDRFAPMTETCMCWGFECGNGWYQILDSLCGNIQSHIDWSQKNHDWDVKYNTMVSKAMAGDITDLEEYYKGYLNAEERMEETLEQGLKEVRPVIPQVVASQVKEKFGGLRFYYTGGDDTIDGMVRMAESWAYNTCESCGQPGELSPKSTGKGITGWMHIHCQACEDQRNKERENASV